MTGARFRNPLLPQRLDTPVMTFRYRQYELLTVNIHVDHGVRDP
jgi:hypothetical protein